LKTDQTPYSYLGTDWISYDDVASVTAKMNIVSARSLAGAFFWSTDQDDYGESICDVSLINFVISLSIF